MNSLFVPSVVAMTSLAAYLAGRRLMGWRIDVLWRTVGVSLEIIGLSFVFLVVNLLIGSAICLAARIFTPVFVSLYVLNDVSVPLLSALEGLVFGLWRSLTRWRTFPP